MKTFAEIYCEQTGLPPAKFGRVLLWRGLYPQARLLKPLLHLLGRDYFAADRDFVYGVGQLRRISDFASEAAEFHSHPANHSLLRRRLRLRVSARRLRRLVEEAFVEPPPGKN